MREVLERASVPLYRLCRHRGRAAGSGGHRTITKPGASHEQAADQAGRRASRPKPVYRELVTINGKNVVLAHNEPPVINAGVLETPRFSA